MERLGELGKARTDLYLRIGMAVGGILVLAFMMSQLLFGPGVASTYVWRLLAGVAAAALGIGFARHLKECFTGLREVSQRLTHSAQ